MKIVLSEPYLSEKERALIYCLNPCYSGNCIEWYPELKITAKYKNVLILVIVEIVLSGLVIRTQENDLALS